MINRQPPIANRQSIRVLIVDDSPTTREYLKYLIDTATGLAVAGVAGNGEEAIRMVKLKHPDIVTMDVQMPKMDGYEATQRIMTENPVPIVMVSATLDQEEIETSFKAVEAGALCALEKPKGPGHPDADRMVKNLLRTLRLMAEIKVIRRRAKEVQTATSSLPATKGPSSQAAQPALVAIGASTGGGPAIKAVLSGLPENLPFPILVVLHITCGFLPGMVKWLNKETALTVEIPANGDRALGGHVYFAPDGHHMGINHRGEIVLSDTPPVNGIRPSVSHLFSSVAQSYGKRGVGVLLTGMGRDGALELLKMRERGAVTIAQDKESSVVFGMPAEAIKMNAAERVLSPEAIANFLKAMGKMRHR